MTARLLVLLLALFAAVPAALGAGRDPAERLRDPAKEALAEEIGRDLRCLVCQNQSIEDSDADLARDLRRIVRERVAAGESREEVIRFVHDRYGDFVLLRPPVKPTTILLWASPALALGGGLVAIAIMRRRAAPRLAAGGPAPLTEAERARLAALDPESRA